VAAEVKKLLHETNEETTKAFWGNWKAAYQ
jgi:hypothetical protein